MHLHSGVLSQHYGFLYAFIVSSFNMMQIERHGLDIFNVFYFLSDLHEQLDSLKSYMKAQNGNSCSLLNPLLFEADFQLDTDRVYTRLQTVEVSQTLSETEQGTQNMRQQPDSEIQSCSIEQYLVFYMTKT